MSHYCEKARWGLRHAGMDYREEAHLQGFNYLATRPRGWGRAVPVLVLGSEFVADSTAILKYLDREVAEERKLYPQDLKALVEADEEDFDEHLGIESRRWVYHHWLQRDIRELVPVAGQRAPGWQKALWPYLFPLFRKALDQMIEPTAEKVQTGLQVIQKTFDRVAGQMADGRRYLHGDRFTAADLSFACMAAPIVIPRGYGIRLPTVDEAPEGARSDIERFSAHPAGQYALRLFAERGLQEGAREAQ